MGLYLAFSIFLSELAFPLKNRSPCLKFAFFFKNRFPVWNLCFFKTDFLFGILVSIKTDFLFGILVSIKTDFLFGTFVSSKLISCVESLFLQNRFPVWNLCFFKTDYLSGIFVFFQEPIPYLKALSSFKNQFLRWNLRSSFRTSSAFWTSSLFLSPSLHLPMTVESHHI